MSKAEPDPVRSPLHYLLFRAKPLGLLAAGLLCGFAASGALYPLQALGVYSPDPGAWLQFALLAGIIHALLFLAVRCIDDIVDLEQDRQNGRWAPDMDPRRTLYPLATLFTLGALALTLPQSLWASLASAISLAILSLPRLPPALKLPIASAGSTCFTTLLAKEHFTRRLADIVPDGNLAAGWRSILLFAAWILASLVSLHMAKNRREGAPAWLPALFVFFIGSSGLLLAVLPWIR